MNLKKRIRVGIEGKSLGNTRDGIFNVTYSLLEEMIKNPDFEFIVFSPYPVLPEELDGNVEHISGGPFSWNPGIWFYAGLPALLRQNAVDVFWEPRQVLPFGIPKKTKIVMTVHDLAFIRFPESLPLLRRKNLEYMCYRSIRKADVVVTVSDFTADEIHSLGLVDRDKAIRTIHNGVDKSLFFLDQAFPANRDGFDFSRRYILAVGSIEPRKNLGLLISTYEEMASALPDLVLVYGNSWKSEDLLERMRKGPAANRIHLFHNVSVAELRCLYSHAEALVMPSLYEGFGLPVLEAMACSCPVFVSDIPVFREIAGDAGLFFKNDSSSLKEALSLSLPKSERERMINKGLEQVKKYNWQESAQAMLALFYEVTRNEPD